MAANEDTDVREVRRALISCHDKAGVAELATELAGLGVELISTGSTAATIRETGVEVTEVADVTGFPECLDGRVKTLHPGIHAGLLADRDNPDHLVQLDELDVSPIDLVVSNLYPFEAAVRSGASDDEIIEMIDIGGPTMVRAAAKNLSGVAVVVSPDDYDALIDHLRDDGGVPLASRRVLAAKAFAHVARYDAAISSWFHRDEPSPAWLTVALPRASALRYGENPHQRAALYAQVGDGGLADVAQLGGKELSYNNLLDTDAAWAMPAEFEAPCVAIVKHTNPAGLAVADDLETAYQRALAGDPLSAFGGIVAANRPIDVATARRIDEVFTEVVIAPGYDAEALEILRRRKNLRILAGRDSRAPGGALAMRAVAGGILAQELDAGEEPFDEWRIVTAAEPDAQTLADLRFAWVAAKHTKSNAITLAADRALVGVGAGQMSRVDAVRLAVEKSDGRHRGAVLASDAFFPFRDGPDAAAEAGVTAIVQPGGSVGDDDVIAAANEHGLVMLFTGRRHFRH